MNIAEILKNCIRGTRLYSPIFGELSLEFVHTSNSHYPIYCNVLRTGITVSFTKDGKNSTTDAEPTLFPSKDQRDWSKFVVPGQETKTQLKPFDKVLVRDEDNKEWECDIFSRLGDKNATFICISDWWYQCIPYEGNEHLLGTKNNP